MAPHPHNEAMRGLLIALVILIAVAEAVMIAAFTQRSQVSTLEIDRDRATIQAQIDASQTDAAKYEGGAIKVLIELRLATLQHTLAMLDQKRASWLRLIPVGYESMA